MTRWRSTFPLDDAIRLDGDASFVGVWPREAADVVQPALLHDARNCVIDDGKVETRPGTITPIFPNNAGVAFPCEFEPLRQRWQEGLAYAEGDEVFHDGTHWRAAADLSAGDEPGVHGDWTDLGFPAAILFDDPLGFPAYGAGRYVDAEGRIFTVQVLADRLVLGREWQTHISVPFATGLAVSATVFVMQAVDKLLLWRGPDLEPLCWNGVDVEVRRLSDHAPDPDDGTSALPWADRALYFQGRMAVPHSRDMVAVSDIGELRYDAAALDEVIDAGRGDPIQTLWPWDRTTLLVFKRRTITALAGFEGDLAGLQQVLVTEAIGTVAPDSVVAWGSQVGFLGPDAFWTLSQVDADRYGLSTKPLSYPVEPLFRRIHWAQAHTSQAIVFQGRLYLAVPMSLDGVTFSESPNAILTFNIGTGGWEGLWTCADWRIRRFLLAPYWGEERLYALNDDGFLFLFGEGVQDQVGRVSRPIASSFTTRGYNPASPERLAARRLVVDLAQQGADYTVGLRFAAGARAPSMVRRRTPSPVRYFDLSSSWDPSNVNLDHGRPRREDYTVFLPEDTYFHPGAGVRLDVAQQTQEGIEATGDVRFAQAHIASTKGRIVLDAVRLEGSVGRRDSRRKV